MAQLTEDYMVEQAAINWLKELGYSYINGYDLSPENQERDTYRQAILKNRFIGAIKRLNPWLTQTQAQEIWKKVNEIEHPDFIMKSKIFYDMLTNGVKITTKEKQEERTKIAKLIDFENLANNDFLAANQYTVEYQYQKGFTRRPDLVIFINGMPIAAFEFKNFNANETAKDAYYDHKTKINDIPQFYVYPQILVASDGLETKHAAKTSDWDRYFIWEGINDDDDLEPKETEGKHYYYIYKPTNERMTSLEVLLKGLFKKQHLLEYLQDFVLYESTGETYQNKIAMFHQFYTTRKAIERTKKTILEGKTPEQKRVGIVWHTQGTGKSLTMMFYAKKCLKQKELENPLLLFITDRNNLDEQLYSVFAQLPIVKQANSIRDLQEIIKTTAGGIIFATIQKFGKKKAEEYPFLTNRHNIIIIADEAHRSQYKELAQNLRKAIPNASFMGFTATPIELADRSTTLVFGDHISIYSMTKAIRHGVVVPINYEARLTELHLTNEFIDEDFEEISEKMIITKQLSEALKQKYEKLEKIMLSGQRTENIAKDIIQHYNKKIQELKGKALIVTISRKVAVKLYENIIKQPNAPSTVLVMSGNKQKDPENFHPHIRTKQELKTLADDFKNPDKNPQIAIVVDMWLTGFDAPCLHTMYFDKPMKGHALVQAIARVNRVYKDKPAGLVVDYIGIADNLRKSLATYTLNTIKETLIDINEVVKLLKEKHKTVTSYFQNIPYQNWKTLPPEQIPKLTITAYEQAVKDEDTKKKFIRNYVALKKLYALASPRPEAYAIKNDLIFFDMIKKMIVKYSTERIRDINRELEYEITELISRSISAQEPIDPLTLMGEEKAKVSIFDDNFLAAFRNMPQKNYAKDTLAKIIKDKITIKMNTNPYRYRPLYDALTDLIDKYNVKLITAAEIIEQLVKIAKELQKQIDQGKQLNLTEQELAFYDLLATKEKFFQNLQEIQQIAKQIVKELGYYTKVADWNRKEYLKAKIRAAVKNLLIKTINGRAQYNEIEQLSTEIINHAETIYIRHT
jgi:type I restriction enzyme R subunit